MSADKMIEELRAGWPDQPFADLCVQFVAFVASQSRDQLQMLTLPTISRIMGRERIDKDVIYAVAVLASTKVAALDPHVLFIDDDGFEVELALKEVDHARSSGTLIHPETGAEIKNFERLLVPFFVPSTRFAMDAVRQ